MNEWMNEWMNECMMNLVGDVCVLWCGCQLWILWVMLCLMMRLLTGPYTNQYPCMLWYSTAIHLMSKLTTHLLFIDPPFSCWSGRDWSVPHHLDMRSWIPTRLPCPLLVAFGTLFRGGGCIFLGSFLETLKYTHTPLRGSVPGALFSVFGSDWQGLAPSLAYSRRPGLFVLSSLPLCV